MATGLVAHLGSFIIHSSGSTDKGLVRNHNEDRWGSFGDGRFLVLADGMGGHSGGEVAAEAIVESLGKWYEKFDHKNLVDMSDSIMLDALTENIRQANAAIFEKGCQEPQLRGMGTTLCCLTFHNTKAIYGHIGDSRIYRFRRGRLERLTRDDSLVSDMLDLGQLEEQDIPDFAYRNVLTRAIGMDPDVEPHVATASLEADDLFLICSDGLTNMLTDEEIAETLASFIENHNQKPPVVAVAETLTIAAKERGGKDNITVVVAAVGTNHE